MGIQIMLESLPAWGGTFLLTGTVGYFLSLNFVVPRLPPGCEWRDVLAGTGMSERGLTHAASLAITLAMLWHLRHLCSVISGIRDVGKTAVLAMATVLILFGVGVYIIWKANSQFWFWCWFPNWVAVVAPVGAMWFVTVRLKERRERLSNANTRLCKLAREKLYRC